MLLACSSRAERPRHSHPLALPAALQPPQGTASLEMQPLQLRQKQRPQALSPGTRERRAGSPPPAWPRLALQTLASPLLALPLSAWPRLHAPASDALLQSPLPALLPLRVWSSAAVPLRPQPLLCHGRRAWRLQPAAAMHCRALQLALSAASPAALPGWRQASPEALPAAALRA